MQAELEFVCKKNVPSIEYDALSKEIDEFMKLHN
jgi:hypothetical protein